MQVILGCHFTVYVTRTSHFKTISKLSISPLKIRTIHHKFLTFMFNVSSSFDLFSPFDVQSWQSWQSVIRVIWWQVLTPAVNSHLAIYILTREYETAGRKVYELLCKINECNKQE